MIRLRMQADRRGSFALEFALIAPFVLIMLIGLIDILGMLGDQHALDEGVAVAARYAVVNSASASAASIRNQFMTAVQPMLGSCGGCTVSVTFTPSYQPCATVTVTATYAWTPLAPITLMGAQSLASATTLTVQN